jgi:hypothetical protein
MGHLTIESLARGVSEAPYPEEKDHLDSCLTCQAELRALREQTEAMGALPDLRPPAGDWEALEGRLVSEGLIRSSGLSFQSARWRSSGWLQAAAALVLFIGGTAIGTRFTGSPEIGDFARGGPPAGLELVPVGSGGQPAANMTDAAAAVRLAERQYIDALVQYRQLMDAQGEPSLIGNPASRFAALEGIVAAGRAAVQQAPADPFSNGVLVSALAEREAILRNASLTRGDGVF